MEELHDKPGGRLSPKVRNFFCLSVALIFLTYFVHSPSAGAQSRSSLEDFESASFYFTLAGEKVVREDEEFFYLDRLAFSEIFLQVLDRASQAISLLSWNKVNKTPSLPKEKYDRVFHFGSWIVDPRHSSCLNTRQKILHETSQAEVSFRPGTCQVDRGEWLDPYTGRTFTRAEELQIDHMVPLKNAFVSGAWRWSKRQRCVYTNFLGNAFHLLPVSSQENLRKSDRTPARYLPPQESYRCEYLRNWLLIKLVWKLAMNPLEAEAIQSEFHRLECQANDFEIRIKFLQEQRERAQRDLEVCQN